MRIYRLPAQTGRIGGSVMKGGESSRMTAYLQRPASRRIVAGGSTAEIVAPFSFQSSTPAGHRCLDNSAPDAIPWIGLCIRKADSFG
jgi:hypothetical protein